jgi:hypothetical protein
MNTGAAITISEGSRHHEQAFHYDALPSGRYRLAFHGYLPLGWVGSLTQGLYDRKISIISGSAKRANMSQWNGEFIVGPLQSAAVTGIDFARLVRDNTTGSAQTPDLSINAFSVRPCFKANGSIYVEMEGHDQIGLLAGIMKKFSSCGLFPWDFSVSTEDSRIYDKFHLMGPGGLIVRKEIVRLLEVKLNEMIR